MVVHPLCIQVLLLSIVVFTVGNLITQPKCPPGKHVFTNCTNPCLYNGSITICATKPDSLCVSDYCGACVTRFYDNTGKEVHCELESGIICEQKTHTISCSSGRVIYVKEANFGRTSKERCRHPYDIERLHNSTTCRAPSSLQVMQKLCNGRVSCEVTVENEMFGADPCYGIYKYLEFDFKCVLKNEINSSKRNIPAVPIGFLLLAYSLLYRNL
ncbi:L-rhamnose-binding lectin CSL1-like isoform X1 [Ostrea edulis]|uniref:L-rhamnose-binding lectin CSL1-like isoform X1 n=1 Tax=Ostrea edulis TaxID=37623 RepID=UPI00209627A9|nr:L-rhamnose-binding lectin CSL1-like isoform X1 [Ostrea edulis]XP_056000484.1 L-rhamnose-binding lectin CSL1-like isoform X1 [Ostrea edulis]